MIHASPILRDVIQPTGSKQMTQILAADPNTTNIRPSENTTLNNMAH